MRSRRYGRRLGKAILRERKLGESQGISRAHDRLRAHHHVRHHAADRDAAATVRNRSAPQPADRANPRGARVNERIHIVTGLLERDGAVLLVASRYPNHTEPLWNLPGGRQRDGELFDAALRREFLEETSLTIEIGPVCYVAESYDRNTHFLVCCFSVFARGDAVLPAGDAHAVALAWVPRAEIATYVTVPVVRDPLLAHLGGNPARYYGYAASGITIEFADPA